MKRPSLRRLRVFLGVAWTRQGPLPFVALAVLALGLFAQGAVHTKVVPLLVAKREQLARAAAPLPVSRSAIDVRAERLESFRAALADGRRLDEAYGKVFALAAARGIALQSADYAYGDEPTGKFAYVQVTYPIHGGYGSVRGFCEDVLLALPFVALDDIRVKREAVSAGEVSANLRFTFFLGASGTKPAVAYMPPPVHEAAAP